MSMLSLVLRDATIPQAIQVMTQQGYRETLTPPDSHTLHLIHPTAMVRLALLSGPEHLYFSHGLSICCPAMGGQAETSGRRPRRGVYISWKPQAQYEAWPWYLHWYWHYLKLCFPLSQLRYHCALPTSQLHREFQPCSLTTAASPPAYTISGPWLTARIACVYCSAGQACDCMESWRVGNGCTYPHQVLSLLCFSMGLGRMGSRNEGSSPCWQDISSSEGNLTLF